MAQKLLTNKDNIFIPNGLSCWFQSGWSGNYSELGDLEDVSITLDPTFEDVWSNRYGVAAKRTRLTTQKNASVALTLREPNVENLQRVLFGGAMSPAQSVTIYESAVLTVQAADSMGVYVDWTKAEDTAANVASIVAAYRTSDVDKSNPLDPVETVPDSTDNRLHFAALTTSLTAGEEVIVFYTKTETGCVKVEIFGDTDLQIEGAAQFQCRSQDGGIMQIWALEAVSLTPNGDLTYPLDAHQTVPLLMTMQERNGTFGYIYVK